MLDLACGTGDLCRDLAARGYAPIGIDFSAGMLAAAQRRRAVGPRRRRRAPRRRRRARRPHVRVRAAQLRRPRRGVRRVRPRRCASAAASPPSTPPCRPTRSCAPGTRCGSAARCRCSGGCSPTTPRRTATCRRAPPTCRRSPSSRDRCARAGFRDVRHTDAHRRFGAAAHGDTRVTTDHPSPARLRAVTREVDSRDRPARRLRPARVRLAAPPHPPRRVRRRGARSRPTTSAPCSRPSTPTTRSASRAPGAIAVGALPFDPDAAGELVVPARVARRARRSGLGHRDRPRRAEPPRPRSRRRRASRSPRRARATSGGSRSSARSRPSTPASSRRSCSRARC